MANLHLEWLDTAEARFHEWLWANPDDAAVPPTCACKCPSHNGHKNPYPQACGRAAQYRYPLNPKMGHKENNWCRECTALWIKNPTTHTTTVMP